MELELESTAIEKKAGNRKLITVAICSISVVLILASSIIYLFVMQNILNDRLKMENSIIKGLSSKLAALEKDRADDSGISKEVFDAQAEYVARKFFFDDLQHDMEGGVVTEDFVVEKATLYTIPALDNRKPQLLGTIDIFTQPSISAKYSGKGLFDFADRELKVKLSDLMKEVNNNYSSVKNILMKDSLPDFNSSKIIITIKNYEIGKYEAGEIKLKGDY